MCDDEGSTKEHVPPKCIFPEAKDIQTGDNYKKNLITVRSCEKHNTAKSKDDVYLLFVLAANVMSNDLAQTQFGTKVMRAVNRTPHVFAEFAKKNTPVTLKGEKSELIHTAAIEIDRARFDSAIEHISYALYYHKLGKTFTGDIQVITDGLMNLSSEDSVEINERIQNFGHIVDTLLANEESKGDNPEVFTYKFLITDAPHQVIIQMNFYCGFKIVSIMKFS
jgi:hypothetical protein